MQEGKWINSVQQESELFRLLIENVQEYAIIVVNPEGRIESWSTGAERLLGFSSNEFIGRSIDIIFTSDDDEIALTASATLYLPQID